MKDKRTIFIFVYECGGGRECGRDHFRLQTKAVRLNIPSGVAMISFFVLEIKKR